MAKKVVTIAPTGQLGTLIGSLPAVPAFNAPLVTQKLANLSTQAQNVLEGAQRAAITSPKAASVGTEFLAAITRRIKEVDEERTDVTGGFDKLVTSLNALFNKGPKAKLEQAKTIMQAKLGEYQKAEQRRAAEEAEAERRRIAAEATAQAQKAVEQGDEAGALEILKDAANVEVDANAPMVRGVGGAAGGMVRRKVGKITDLRAFLVWAGSNQSQSALAVCGGITVGQRELNQLAATVLAINEDPPMGVPAVIPGFEAGYDETFNAR